MNRILTNFEMFVSLSAPNAEELLKNSKEIVTHTTRNKSEASGFVKPSQEWQDEQVKDFTNVRMRLARHIELIRSRNTETSLLFPKPKDRDGMNVI